MKILLLILGVVVVVLNLLLWYSKKQARKAKADKSAGPEVRSGSQDARAMESLKNPEVGPLKQSAAAELGITIEQLDRLSVEEIEALANERGLL
jgi:hypothetical protein